MVRTRQRVFYEPSARLEAARDVEDVHVRVDVCTSVRLCLCELAVPVVCLSLTGLRTAKGERKR